MASVMVKERIELFMVLEAEGGGMGYTVIRCITRTDANNPKADSFPIKACPEVFYSSYTTAVCQGVHF